LTRVRNTILAVLTVAITLACGESAPAESGGGGGADGSAPNVPWDTAAPPAADVAPSPDTTTPGSPHCPCGAMRCGAPPGAECAEVVCGTCRSGEHCVRGRCVVADCEGRECGPSRNYPEVACGQCAAEHVLYCDGAGRCTPCPNPCGVRECGPRPGCPGLSCGSCPDGEQCSDVGFCYAPVPRGTLGDSCHFHYDCHDALPSLGLGPSANFPACLHDLCDGGFCWYHAPGVPFCSRPCVIDDGGPAGSSDARAAEGEEMPTPSSPECEGNLPTLFEGSFRCVNLAAPGAPPMGFCMPGSDFRRCVGDRDCPAGESCRLALIDGVTSTYCLTAPRHPVPLSAPCNHVALAGAVQPCESGLCLPSGCSAYCADDDDCRTYDRGCDMAQGYCLDNPQTACASDHDCSAWLCRHGQTLFAESDDKFALCTGRDCFHNADCRDRKYFCDPRGSSLAPDSMGSTQDPPRCVWRPQGSVDMGEPCGAAPEGPRCHSDLCLEGLCSGLCTSDSHCATARGQRCVYDHFPLFDGKLVGLCFPFPGVDGQSPFCRSATQCPDGSSCALYPAGDHSAPERGRHVAGICLPDEPERDPFAASCDPAGAISCRGHGRISPCRPFAVANPSRLESALTTAAALQTADPVQDGADTLGYCATPCRKTSDCPHAVFPDGQRYGGLCLSASVAGDLVANFCVPEPTASSLEDCSETKRCTVRPESEVCFANVLAGSPGRGPVVEYVCRAVFGESSPRPVAALGAPCRDHSDCETLLCHGSDTSAEGYCSAWCSSQDDCEPAGLVCVPEEYVIEATPSGVIIPSCRRPPVREPN
jgi:hypothetical protein